MSKLKNIAVLIDADNISSQRIDWVFAQIQTLGMITTKRIYGDFAKSHLSSWESAILQDAIEKKHQTSYSTGKNSSDIALAIDAMDLLYTHQCDAFCIVSSDSDFIGLALRLRRNNIQVFGFGENKTIKEFRQACSRFFEVPENDNIYINQEKTDTVQKNLVVSSNQLKSDTKLLNALRHSIQECLQNGWANYGTLNSYLLKNYSDLSPQKYGYSKWSDVILQIDLFVGETRKGGLFIAFKNNSNQVLNSNNKYSQAQLKKNTVLIGAIRDSIEKNLDNGWAYYGVLNSYLNQKYPNLKPKNYGYSKWRNIIECIDLFEVKVNNSSVFIREKANNKKIVNEKLIEDILLIINQNVTRTDEWVHIGYLGSQLKNQGYNPKNFGFKSFALLFDNLEGIVVRKNGSTIHLTLEDTSRIQNIQSRTHSAIATNIELFQTNQDKILGNGYSDIDDFDYPPFFD